MKQFRMKNLVSNLVLLYSILQALYYNGCSNEKAQSDFPACLILSTRLQSGNLQW